MKDKTLLTFVDVSSCRVVVENTNVRKKVTSETCMTETKKRTDSLVERDGCCIFEFDTFATATDNAFLFLHFDIGVSLIDEHSVC